MVKIALWLGTPSMVTFLASAASDRLLNTLVIFALSIVLLLFGIGPRPPARNGL